MFQPNFTYTHEIVRDLMNIERCKTSLEYLHLPTRVRQELAFHAKMKSTHFSTSIEGNLLSYDQVERVICEKGRNTKINAEQEVLNYWNALTFLEQASEEKLPVTLDFIRRLHGIIVQKGKTPKRSAFRQAMPPGVLFAVFDSQTRTPEYIPPEWTEIEPLMKDLTDWYRNEDQLPPPVKAAIFFYQFVTIHPFEDGNGRTARALATYILMIHGYNFRGFNSMEEYYAMDLKGYYENIQMGLPVLYYKGRNEPPHLEIWVGFFLRIMALCAEKIYGMAKDATGRKPQNPLVGSLTPKDRKMLRFVLENHLELIRTKDLADLFHVTPRAVSDWCKDWCARKILVPNRKIARVSSYSLAETFRDLDLSELGFRE